MWRCVATIGALLLLTDPPSAGAKLPFGKEGTIKVRVHDPAVAQAVAAAGGRLIADYGPYCVLETDPSTFARFHGDPAVESRPDENVIWLQSGPLDTSRPAVRHLYQSAAPTDGKSLRLVQCAGPIRADWFDALGKTGVRVVSYVPQNTYLVYGDGAALGRLRSLAAAESFVQWEGAFVSEHKIHPLARAGGPAFNPARGGVGLFRIQLVSDPDANAQTLQAIEAMKSGAVKSRYEILEYVNLVVSLPAERLPKLAGRPDVVTIQPYQEPTLLDERQGQIVAGAVEGDQPSGSGYLSWLANHGFAQAQFDASNFVIDLTDSGVDNGTPTPNHFGLYAGGIRPGQSRLVYCRLVGTPNPDGTTQGCDGHGNINAHIIGGYNDLTGFPHQDPEGYLYGLGVAPFARIGASVIFDPVFTSPAYPELASMAYRDGARISSNSWGINSFGAYWPESQTYDALVRDAQPAGTTSAAAGNQEMVFVFAAGNSGPGASSIWAPATAKNVITVGAAEGVRSFGASDGCDLSDVIADRAGDIAPFSSRGPTADGRNKPDLVAPGTHVTGGVFQTASPGPLGTAAACFTSLGICGGPGRDFYPAGQQWYTASSGTSHSCPAVAGGAALVRQYFINQGRTAPSPAMTKAILLNAARYLRGVGAGDTLPSPAQGMGEIDLGAVFERGTIVPTILRDQLPADMFTATGQTRIITGTIADPTKPFRVTLAWTDAPGATFAKPSMNDLDLVVTVQGNVFRGNVFVGPRSVTGGVADQTNNVESVFLPANLEGTFSVSVVAANITANGVPNVGGALDQDFALVIYNATEQPVPILTSAGWNLQDSCLPLNGAPDPHELVTVYLAIRNTGTLPALSVTGTLLASSDIESPSGPQDYGDLNPGGPPVSRSFTFRVGPGCGEPAVLPLRLQAGTTDLGLVTFTLDRGVPSTTFAESFDGVAAPALPQGWTAALAAGSGPTWTTSGVSSDSSPNAAFTPVTPGVAVDSRLTSPAIPIITDTARLRFRHRHILGTQAGGVLEMSIAGGAFQDILAAGGAFLEGGYGGVVVPSLAVLSGREVWTGNSGGFITTIVRLPAAAAGKSVRLRWRVGTEPTSTGTGWYVDSIALYDGVVCCAPPEPMLGPPSVTATRTGPVTYLVSFDKPITGFDSPEDVQIIATGSATVGTVDVSGVGAGPYTVTMSALTGIGTLGIAVKAGAGFDADGNPSLPSAPSMVFLVADELVDGTITRRDPDPTAASTLGFEIAFSQPVQDFSPADVEWSSNLERAGAGFLSGGGTNYTFEVANVIGNGTVCARIPAGAVHDALGNPNAGFGPVCYTVTQIAANTDFSFQLVALPVPDLGGTATALPETLQWVRPNQTFYVEVWMRDEKNPKAAPLCALADLLYDPLLVQAVAVTGEGRERLPAGQVTQPGLADELGGCNQSKTKDPTWLRFSRVSMRVAPFVCYEPPCEPVVAHFSLNAGESDPKPVKVVSGNIVYGGLDLRVVPTVRPDLDGDGDVDLDDVELFGGCVLGPAIPHDGTDLCRQADFDQNGSVDQYDFGRLQRCYSGRDVPAGPDCAN